MASGELRTRKVVQLTDKLQKEKDANDKRAKQQRADLDASSSDDWFGGDIAESGSGQTKRRATSSVARDPNTTSVSKGRTSMCRQSR